MKSGDLLTYNGACCGLSFMTQDTGIEKREIIKLKVIIKNLKPTGKILDVKQGNMSKIRSLGLQIPSFPQRFGNRSSKIVTCRVAQIQSL